MASWRLAWVTLVSAAMLACPLPGEPAADSGEQDAGPTNHDSGAPDSGVDAGPDGGGEADGGADAGPDAGVTIVFDCPNDGGCLQIDIQGSPSTLLPGGQPGVVHGFSDPSIRRDPTTGTLWMNYSHAATHAWVDGGAVLLDNAISSHLARSTDDGGTWVFDHVVRASASEVNLGSAGGQGYSEFEVSTLAFAPGAPGLWYSLAHRYHNPIGPPGNWFNPTADGHQLVMDQQTTVANLGSGLTQRLVSAQTATAWGAGQNLSTLDASLQGCALWTEPALFVQGATVYLLAQCLAVFGGQLRRDLGFYALFAAPAGVVAPTWRFVGRVAGNAEAMELDPRAVEVTEADLALSRDGALLFIATPNQIAAQEKHLGCWALELESLEPPRLRRVGGQLVVRAIIRQSDADAVLGPGPCAYEPASQTGVVMVHRMPVPGQGTTYTLHATGVHP